MKVLTPPTIGGGALAGLKVALRPPAGGVRKGYRNDLEFAHAPGVSGVAPARLAVAAQPELPRDERQPGVLVVGLPFQELAEVLAGRLVVAPLGGQARQQPQHREQPGARFFPRFDRPLLVQVLLEEVTGVDLASAPAAARPPRRGRPWP